MGKVMGDLSSRRGRIQGIETDGGFQVIKAQVPVKDLYHYSSNLRSLTGGRGGAYGRFFFQPLRGNAARRGGKGD